MKILQFIFLLAVTSSAALSSPGGPLEKVTKIQVDPTIIEQPEKVKDPMAANLVQYNLRAAVKDAHLQEGASPIRTHVVLDEFLSEGGLRRVMGTGSGRSKNTVDGRLVIQDATGNELASVKIHVHGSVAFTQGDGGSPGAKATSDFEQCLIPEIEKLK